MMDRRLDYLPLDILQSKVEQWPIMRPEYWSVGVPE